MSALLGMNNTTAHALLSAFGQPMTLIQPTVGSFDHVAGVVTPGANVTTAVFGYPQTATEEYAKQYGVNNVQENDILCLIEAVIEPSTNMKLQIGSDPNEIYSIVTCKTFTKSGFAYLFICLARK